MLGDNLPMHGPGSCLPRLSVQAWPICQVLREGATRILLQVNILTKLANTIFHNNLNNSFIYLTISFIHHRKLSIEKLEWGAYDPSRLPPAP